MMLHVHVVLKTLHMNDLFCLISNNKIFFLPTYTVPIGLSTELERGNKQYFNLGLMHT
jgi:hypothetical protein